MPTPKNRTTARRIAEVQRMILNGTTRTGSTVAAFGLLRMKGWI